MTRSAAQLIAAAQRLGRDQTVGVLLPAAARGLGFGLLLLALFLGLDRLLPDPAARPTPAWVSWVRTLGLAGIVLVPLVTFARALIARWPAMRNLTESARRTEGEAEELRERLVPALQLLDVRDEVRTGYSNELVDAFVDDTSEAVARVKSEDLPYRERRKHGFGWFAGGAVAVAVATLWLGFGPARDALGRLATAPSWLGPRPPAQFVVASGDLSVPRGESVDLEARVDHATFRRDSAEATLEWRAEGEETWRELVLTGRDVSAHGEDGTRVPAAEFTHRFDDVRESFEYRFRHGPSFSESYDVRAMPHPSLAIEEVRYVYPEYTGLPDRVVRDGAGDLAAVQGTVAHLVARSTNPPAEAGVRWGEAEELTPLEFDEERRLRTSIELREETTYTLHVTDELGLRNQNPIEYRVRVLSDEAPFIRLLSPGEDRDLDESMRVDLRYSAVDDYGLAPVRLVYEVSRREGRSERQTILRPSAGTREINETWTWDLAGLDLLPGDDVAYHLEVQDNCITGVHTAKTRQYLLRLPTIGEIFAEIDQQEAEAIEDMAEILEEAKRIEEKVEEVSREILKQGETSWENQKEVERALEAQEQMAEQLDKVQQDLQQNLEQLAESQFLTQDAQQKMEQIQKLLDEVASAEMREALEKLRQAMEEANPRRTEENLADFEQAQEQLQKQLDRVLENLKQFRLEEKMKAAVREMEELAARQERVNDELAQLDVPTAEDVREEEARGEGEDEAAGEDSEGDEGEHGDEADAESSDGDEGEESSEEGEGSESEGESEGDSEGDESESDESESDGGSEGESSESKGSESESSESEDSESDASDSQSGESSDRESESGDGESSDGESSESEGSESESSESSESGSESESSESQSGGEQSESEQDLDRLAEEEKALAEEAERLQESLKEIAEMVQEMRDSQDSEMMDGLSQQMDESQVQEMMEQMAEQLQDGQQQEAEEQGEKALTELRKLAAQLQSGAQGMQMRQIQISQAAINRAVRDLLSLSGDEELLTGDLETLPRTSTSATRSFADEQHLLIQGAERVDEMLHEVAKDTPLMESSIGRDLAEGIESMKDAASGLENGAIQLAHDDGENAIDEINAVVIKLLETVQSMGQSSGSCSSGMPGSMQQLQELSQDQQALNEALEQLRREGGKSMSDRLQAQLDRHAAEQRRIQEQLQQLLQEIEDGEGEGTLGRLDDVPGKLEDVAKRLESGDFGDEVMRDQDWALTRLLDSQRSMRERELGRERRSNPGEELADLLSPDALPEGLEKVDRDLREDLLKALDRGYPPKYEELIKEYFRSLSRDEPSSELP